jgi:ligand-binding sensor domain-containing protein
MWHKQIITRMLGLALGLLAFHIALAQSSQFKNYSVNEGLSSSEAYNVMQDSKGYMWFCTDGGVSQFDGYNFKVFNTNNGLPDNNVFEAQEDYKGRIWFRSYSGKLSYYYHDSIFRLRLNDSLVKVLKVSQISSLAIDSSDNLYLGICGYLSPIRISLKHDNTFSYLPSYKGMTYIYSLPSSGIISGIYPYNDSTVQAKVPPLTICNFKLQSNSIDTLNVLSRRNGRGTALHDKTLKLTNGNMATTLSSRFLLLNNNYKLVFSFTFPNMIFDIVPDKENRIWIITNDEEPLCYENGKIKRYAALDFLKNKHITAMCLDNQGGLWFTSLDHGVYYLNSLEFKTWTTDNGLPGNKVNVLSIAPDSTVWISVSQNNKITLLRNDSISYKSIPSIPDITINDILFRDDKSIWASTSNGLFIFPNTYSLNALVLSKDLNGKDAIPDSDGRVWYNTHRYIYLLEEKAGSVSVLKDLKVNQRIFKICKDGHGGLMIGTSGGLWNYNNDSLSFLGSKYKDLCSRFGDITVTADGVFWGMSTDAGIIVKSGNKIYHITENDGLVSNFCTCVYLDYKGRMWVGTRNGLSCISFSNKAPEDFHIQSIKNMQAPELTEVNCIKCLGNMVYAGTNSGLTTFNTNEISADTFQPPVYITGISVNDKIMQSLATTLTLKHDENNIVINYVGLEYKDAGKVQYRYKIDGIDTGWVYTKSISVSYPKLPPGNYTFIVSAMNHDGVWNAQAASISFDISAAWWNTWWARISGMVLIAGFVYWRVITLTNRERRKSEISKQLAIAELQKLKAQFDPHFMFNNLNTLSSLIDTSPKNALEFVDELSQFYHYNIRYRKQEFTEVREELEYAKRYYNLLAIRFGNLLTIKWAVDAKYSSYFILTNSLQLLLENVVKHNNILADKRITVEIKSTENCSIAVSNDVFAKTNIVSSGVGISSINERYRLLTDKQILVSSTTEYFSVELPLIIPKEYEDINNRG